MLMNILVTKLTWLLPLIIFIVACNGKSMQSSYVNNYPKALDSLASQPLGTHQTITGFMRIFNRIQHGELAKIVHENYTEQLYFNDTFRTITDRNELVDYLQQTGQQVDWLEAQVQDVARGEHDFYVRWIMRLQFTVMGKQVNSESIGISQLRFNKQGQIIFHQDFWDGVDGFYQHLPIIGYLLRKIREKL
ncbi:hypothetical protein CDW43_07225 [Methylophaga nitratireducenticrescens]|nr:hypothetical protein CDW43_07225 [Methylophaga nitratireducenticrescens]